MSEQEKGERVLTRYMVFRVRIEQGQANEVWQPLGWTENSSGPYAIQSKADEPGEYRAVPVRNITAESMAFDEPPPPRLVPVRKQVIEAMAANEADLDGKLAGEPNVEAQELAEQILAESSEDAHKPRHKAVVRAETGVLRSELPDPADQT